MTPGRWQGVTQCHQGATQQGRCRCHHSERREGRMRDAGEGPWAGGEPPAPRFQLGCPGAVLGAGPAPLPTQLRSGDRATPGPGTLLPVPKDTQAAVTTICSLAAEPARPPSPEHRHGGSPCSCQLSSCQPRSQHLPYSPEATPRRCFLRFPPVPAAPSSPAGCSGCFSPCCPIPSLPGAPGAGQTAAAPSLPSSRSLQIS